MRSGASNSGGSISRKNSKDWNYNASSNIYNGWIRDGFTWKEDLETKNGFMNWNKLTGPKEAFLAARAEGAKLYIDQDNFSASDYYYVLNDGHIGTTRGKQDFDNAKRAFDARDPKIIINADKTWLSVTNAEKQVDVWNRKLKP
jgi:hypothetical protein